MSNENNVWIATGQDQIYMNTKMVNRHGLIAGATGTGKTVTIKVLTEAFSDMGVPVFLADIKGDVSGLSQAGESSPKIEERVKNMNISDFAYKAYPVRFFDVYGKKGIPVRTTISDMGPILIARILGLNETQTGVLQIIFKVADDNKLLLIDLKDLRSMVQHVGDHAKEYTTTYGMISTQSIGAIQRSLLSLSTLGGDEFFGEPELDIQDWISCDENGKGYVNILDCVTLAQNPQLYSTFLLWMLSALYEMLPEVGDMDKPKMVFFFDEAHLLFSDAPKALLQKVEQVVRLIRSKGVGIYFISQSPSDIPDTVLAQLGNKVQHALRAYTPKDQKAVKAAAASYRPNPEFNSETVLGELSTGEALISLLDENGAPQVVQRGFILPPKSYLGAVALEHINQLTQSSPLYAKYGQAIDRQSAYEILQEQEAQAAAQQQREQVQKQPTQKQTTQKASAKKSSTNKPSAVDKMVGSALNQIGREVGRSLIRGLLGNRKR